ncbi:aminopeptidase [Microbacterium koreense]|uniref:Aminopeptidase n=1 Tax=Microbacterium koreense TaxID=323761 RepID=A0ABW2ZMN5_9MICO
MLSLDTTRSSICLDTCLAVQPGEVVTLLHDPHHADDAAALAAYAASIGASPRLVPVPERHLGEKDVSPEAAAQLRGSDVLVVVFDPEDACQFWHTQGRMDASADGARVGLLFPPAHWDLTADDLRVTEALTDRLGALLDAASDAHLTTVAGTDLRMSLAGREGFSCHSILHEPGATATIPDWGDAEISPLEGTATGRIVYDASIAFIGEVDVPIVVEVVDGAVTTVEGGASAAQLRHIFDTEGPAARNIAELGIGTVPRGEITGHKDDKLFGTVHVAMGHNVSLGGVVDAPVHLDGVLHNPTLVLDGREVLVEGRLAPWLADELSRPELASEPEGSR